MRSRFQQKLANVSWMLSLSRQRTMVETLWLSEKKRDQLFLLSNHSSLDLMGRHS